MAAEIDSRRKSLSLTGSLFPNAHIIFFALSVAIPGVVYLITLCPTVEYIDSGELALACKHLGIAHPTGYPLYTIMGRLAGLCLWGELIYKMNLLSLIFTSLASGFLFLCIREFISMLAIEKRSGDLIAFSTALFASFTPIWWAQGTTNEVYSLNLLLIPISLWAVFKYIRERKSKWLFASSYTLGLSLTNHLSAAYIVPAYIFLLVYLWKKSYMKRDVILLAGLFFPIPLSMYLFLPIRARFAPFLNWGGVDDIYFLFKHISGWQYHIWMFSGSGFSISLLIDKIISAASLMYRQFSWFGLILCCAGMVVSSVRKTNLFIFAVLIILLNFVYASNYEIIDIESYYLPMVAVLSIFAAVGIVFMANTALRIFNGKGILKYLIPFIIILLPVSNFIENFFISDRSGRIFAKQSALDMIDSMEPGGLAFVENWDFYSPWLYLHFENNFRGDMVLLDKELMRRSWYIDFIRRNHPEIYRNSSKAIEEFLREVKPFERSLAFDAAVIDRAYYNMLHSITVNELKNRPVYTNVVVDKKFTGVLPLVPSGILFRIVNTDQFVEADLFEFNEALWGSRFIYRDKRVSAVLSYYQRAFLSREKYCRYFEKDEEAEYYKKMAAKVTAVMTEISRNN